MFDGGYATLIRWIFAEVERDPSFAGTVRILLGELAVLPKMRARIEADLAEHARSRRWPRRAIRAEPGPESGVTETSRKRANQV